MLSNVRPSRANSQSYLSERLLACSAEARPGHGENIVAGRY